MGELRNLVRESRLARIGAWCAVACVPGLVYLAGAPVFGYAISSAPAVVAALLLPLGAEAALSSGLVAVAAFRSGYALAHSDTPEPPPQPLAPPSLGLRDNPILGLVVALVFVVFAAADFRARAPDPIGPEWFFLSGAAVGIGYCCLFAVGFRTARRREQAMMRRGRPYSGRRSRWSRLRPGFDGRQRRPASLGLRQVAAAEYSPRVSPRERCAGGAGRHGWTWRWRRWRCGRRETAFACGAAAWDRMKGAGAMRTRIALLGLVLGLLGGAWAQGPTVVPEIPFRQFTLPNGLRVILSEDHAVPVVTESLCFNVGGRDEHRGSSGFAHLFEHLMFEGSEHARKGVFDHLVEGYGGTDNASTHTDYTFYFETAPSNALPILMWLDADRMAYLNVTPENMKNQIAVVEEEKRLRVDNEPYGPLLYIDMGEDAFSNWQNAHPVIGSFADLDRATLAEVKAFFDSYYAPRNAILTIAGDIDPVRTEALVRKYFAWIPNRGTITPVVTAEPPRTRETDVTVRDPHANLPALAIAWQGPRRGTPEFYALALLGQDLFAGDSSRLYQSLVKTEKVAIEVDGGLNFPGGDFTDYRAPGLFGGFAIYKPTASAQLIEQLIFREIHEIAANGMPADELLRVKTKLASDWIRNEQTTLDRAQLLALGELMDGTPAGASEDLRKILNVTSEQIQAAAVEYLTHARATVIVNMPGAAAATAAKTGAKP